MPTAIILLLMYAGVAAIVVGSARGDDEYATQPETAVTVTGVRDVPDRGDDNPLRDGVDKTCDKVEYTVQAEDDRSGHLVGCLDRDQVHDVIHVYFHPDHPRETTVRHGLSTTNDLPRTLGFVTVLFAILGALAVPMSTWLHRLSGRPTE